MSDIVQSSVDPWQQKAQDLYARINELSKTQSYGSYQELNPLLTAVWDLQKLGANKALSEWNDTHPSVYEYTKPNNGLWAEGSFGNYSKEYLQAIDKTYGTDYANTAPKTQMLHTQNIITQGGQSSGKVVQITYLPKGCCGFRKTHFQSLVNPISSKT